MYYGLRIGREGDSVGAMASYTAEKMTLWRALASLEREMDSLLL